MPVEMTMNLENYFGKLDHLGKAVFPLAASEALNDVAFGTIRLLKKEIPKYVDRPVKYTVSGIQTDKSSVKTLRSLIGYEKHRYWLTTITYGGMVRPYPKARVLVEPIKSANVVNKSHGNLPRNYLKKRKANSHLYFIGKPNNRAGTARRYGLYRYYKTRAPKLLVALDRTQRYQKKLFPADTIGMTYIRQSFMRMFQLRMRHKLAKAQIPTGF